MENAMAACTRCLADPHDFSARADLMWVAALALSGLSAAGLGRVGFPMHLIEHSLSALYDIPHGAGLAVIMLGWLRAHVDSHARRIAQLGQRVFGLGLSASSEQTALQTITALHHWLGSVAAPTTLTELHIPHTDIPRIADNSQGLARIWRLAEYSPHRVAAILHLCR